MWMRHLLIGLVTLVGIGVVGSQLKKRRLEIPEEIVPATDIDAQFLTTVERVDTEFRRHWQAHGLQPARKANPLLIARRLSLGLTGTVPSLEEIRALESIQPQQQLVWWLDHLLSGRRYSDYVAERLARVLVGTENGPFIVFRRRRFVAWLSDCLHENKPYDELVRSLISDHGLWTDSPAINFITVTNGSDEEGQPDEKRLAARTTRAFLGVRLDCMQCHDDNLGGEWLQSDFHQLAAFYSGARQSGLGIQDTPRDYLYKYLGEDEEQTVVPHVPFNAELLPADGPRRQQLAQWVTHPENHAFSRTIVNRMWALMCGRPLVEPIDDIPLEGPYPPGLETLAGDFASHGFDLRRLISLIAATHAFQQDSRAEYEITPAHEQHWAVFPLSRLRPEQVAGSIIQASSLSTIDSNSHIIVRLARFGQLGDFVTRYGDTGEDEFEDHGGTIPQRLVMLNGELIKEKTKDDLFSNAATRIAQQVADDPKAIESAYLVALSRRPTSAESEHFQSVIRQGKGLSRAEALEDVFWTLLNSTEFSWNH